MHYASDPIDIYLNSEAATRDVAALLDKFNGGTYSRGCDQSGPVHVWSVQKYQKWTLISFSVSGSDRTIEIYYRLEGSTYFVMDNGKTSADLRLKIGRMAPINFTRIFDGLPDLNGVTLSPSDILSDDEIAPAKLSDAICRTVVAARRLFLACESTNARLLA